MVQGRTPRLEVPGNAGIGSLLTDDSLTAVYQDGRTCVGLGCADDKTGGFYGGQRTATLQGDLLAAVREWASGTCIGL